MSVKICYDQSRATSATASISRAPWITDSKGACATRTGSFRSAEGRSAIPGTSGAAACEHDAAFDNLRAPSLIEGADEVRGPIQGLIGGDGDRCGNDFGTQRVLSRHRATHRNCGDQDGTRTRPNGMRQAHVPQEPLGFILCHAQARLRLDGLDDTLAQGATSSADGI